MTSQHQLSATILSAEPILRLLLAAPDAMTADEMAKAMGKDPSNIRKAAKAYAEADLLTTTAVGQTTVYAVAQGGREALAALDRAAGLGITIGERPRWPLDQIAFNPDNIRKTIDPDSLAGLADTIVEAEDILQEIILYPPNASGVRMLHAGERRTRACHLLTEQGRLPAALQAGLPFTERAGTKAEAMFIGLVENGQREDIPAWEDTKGLAAYAAETGLSARAIAFKTGRAREGSEEGVRDVQEKIRVAVKARESYPDDVARLEAGQISFDNLKRLIRTPLAEIAEQIRPIDLMMLAEIRHKGSVAPKRHSYGGVTECSFSAGQDLVLKGLVSQGLVSFTLQSHDDHRAYVQPGHASHVVLAAEECRGLGGNDAQSLEALHRLRVAAIGAEQADLAAAKKRYATPWLNGPFFLSAAAQAKADKAKIQKSDERKANADAKQAREDRAQAVQILTKDLEREARKARLSADADADIAALGLMAELRKAAISPPFRVDGRWLRDSKGQVLADLDWRFGENKPLAMELVALALNVAVGFPPTEDDFIGMISGRLRLLGAPDDKALQLAVRALDRVTDTLGVAFGDPSEDWTQADACAIADAWFKDFGGDLPEDPYLEQVAGALLRHGYIEAEASTLAPTLLAADLERLGITFGDQNYAWDQADATRLADEYVEGLPGNEQSQTQGAEADLATILEKPATDKGRDAYSEDEYRTWIADFLVANHKVDRAAAPAWADQVLVEQLAGLRQAFGEVKGTWDRSSASFDAMEWADLHLVNGQPKAPEQSQTQGEEVDAVA